MIFSGETDANKERRIQGHVDIPLNECGREQARRAGKALSHYKLSRAYCSDLQRTQQTASIILEQSDMPLPPKLVQDPRIKEQGFGWMENMLLEDANRELRKKNISSLAEFQYDDGITESKPAVINRVVHFFKTLCQSVYDKNKDSSNGSDGTELCEALSSTENFSVANDEYEAEELSLSNVREEDICETILVASHGAALRYLYKHFRNNLKCVFPSSLEVYPRNTAYSTFIVRYSPRKYALVCEQYNSDSHIDGLS
ncbi:Histidine phosphatase superfamily clade-1 [Trinorchestia longiramus]|nr:Histidine phosphatase superfamily clade-1 [Trinorchestia longiramus]